MNTRLIGLALSGALLLAACGGAPPPRDTTAPTITLTDKQTVTPDATSVTVTGKVGDNRPVSELAAAYSVDGGPPQLLALKPDGSFSFSVPLPAGKSGALIVVAVKDKAGNAAEAHEIVTRAQLEQTLAFSGSVALQRAGAAVAGATVKVEGRDVQTTTDANGRFALKVPISAKTLLITKDGYGTVRIENLDPTQTPVLDEIMRPLFDLSLPSVAPTVTLDLADGVTIGNQDLTITATVQTTSEANPPKDGIASVGSSAGNSGYLNAGRVRSVVSVADGTGVFSFKAASLAAFSGLTEVHVNIYDFNGNHTDVIRYVKAAGTANAVTAVAPTKLAPTAVTFADTGTFGALGKNPQAGAALKRWALSGDAGALNALASGGARPDSTVQPDNTVQPQAAPQGTNLWVDVNFSYDPAAPTPRAFELYRSLDGSSYTQVLSVAPAAVRVDPKKPESGYVIRDTSSLLTPGTKTYYKVRAVSDAGGQDSAAVDVTPLGRYSITLTSPGQAATGVETRPIFRWKTSGASAQEVFQILVLDRLQAEGSTTQWISAPFDKTTAYNVGNAVIYNADGLAQSQYLQPFHAYEWQMAAATASADGKAVSIAADFFNILGLTGFPVRTGPVNEFVTGGY